MSPFFQPLGTMATIRFWDIETGNLLRDLSGAGEQGLGNAALSPDGRTIAVVDFRGVRILDAATGILQRTIDLPALPHFRRQPTFSPDGTLVTLPDQNSVAIVEAASGRRLHHDASTPVGPLVSAAWSPSGDRIVTGHDDGFVRAWDALTGRLVWHPLLAPVVSKVGWTAHPAFVGFQATASSSLAPAAGMTRLVISTASSHTTTPWTVARCANSLNKRSSGRRWRPTVG
jgi:WD40 repeat protein